MTVSNTKIFDHILMQPGQGPPRLLLMCWHKTNTAELSPATERLYRPQTCLDQQASYCWSEVFQQDCMKRGTGKASELYLTTKLYLTKKKRSVRQSKHDPFVPITLSLFIALCIYSLGPSLLSLVGRQNVLCIH